MLTKRTTMQAAWWLVLVAVASWASRADAKADPQAPSVIPTFHCLGLYWSPAGGAAEKEVRVRYRRQGAAEWKEGLPLRYNPIAGADEGLSDYRGSIVNLSPDTAYEVELTLAGGSPGATLKARTWSEEFPTGPTVTVLKRDTTLLVHESGRPQAYRVYDGRGATIDVRHQHNQCIAINASYVIVRGLTLKGAGAGENTRGSQVGAIEIAGGHDIVIEDCEISDWGRHNPQTGFGYNCDSAVFSRSSALKHLIVQRCRIHHPRWDGSTWFEPKYPTHTAGPQYISLFDTAGNHVIRYNECWSDLDHMCNDGIGGGSNGSFRGSPGPDSDIYGNVVSHCWDDGVEVEGGSRNVRVWGNYVTQAMNMIGNAPASIGPLYIWGNVVGRSQAQPDGAGANFLKMGFATSEAWMTGHLYIFHNTLFQEDGWLPKGGLGGNRIVKHTVSRNNILQVRSADGYSASENEHNLDNDFDYDLYNGRIPQGCQPHGVRGEPIYAAQSGFDAATKTGRFQLAPNSPGAHAGQIIPNFSDGYSGAAPDIGAHQQGTPPMQFGVRARQK